MLFDTETTGLDPASGDRVVEVAAVELVNGLPTGRHFHALVDPERDIPDEVVRIHGITTAAVRGKPKFVDIAPALLDFLADGHLVAHNAAFDFAFLDAEFTRIGHPRLARDRMVDTLAMAKARFPGLPASLDALCRRFGIDLSERTSHNALLDCRLLAEVYIELTGGRQRGLSLVDADGEELPIAVYGPLGPREPRMIVVPPAMLAAHAMFLGRLKEALWLR